LGYDNAHAVKVKGKRFSGQRLPFDHKHRHVADKGVPYEFKNAHQLMSDFFAEVDSVLQEVKTR
jgi:outer membrane receptor for Fe3+-dicitrate